jgi:hypothetical protein
MRKSVGECSNDGSFSGSFTLAILDDLILNSPHVPVALRRKSANSTIWGQGDIHKSARVKYRFTLNC